MKSGTEKLKILYLIKTMGPGGAERITLDLCRYFRERLNEVSVFSSGGILLKELDSINANHIEFSDIRKKNFPSLRSALKKVIENGNFDIIHSQQRIFLPILKSLNTTGKAKIIYTANNYFDDLYQGFLFADAAVAISPYIETNLRNTVRPGTKIFRINYGVQSTGESCTQTDRHAFGFFGRLIKEKGVFQLIRAVQDLPPVGAELLICGDGPGKEKIGELIVNNPANNKIGLMDPVSEIDEFYDKIDTLVLPTELNEGLPVSILEALSRKKLVIATAAGAISDIISNQETGYILENNSPACIKEKILQVLSNDAGIETIRNNGYKRVREEYSLESMLRGYENLYRHVLQQEVCEPH